MIRLEETKVRTNTEMIKSDCLWGMNWVGGRSGMRVKQEAFIIHFDFFKKSFNNKIIKTKQKD